MAAHARIGDTGEYDLDTVNQWVGSIYPGKAFDLINQANLPEAVAKLIYENGYRVEAVDGDSYDKCQWLKVEDDFKIEEPESDDEKEWDQYEEIREKVSDLRQAYANALAREVMAQYA